MTNEQDTAVIPHDAPRALAQTFSAQDVALLKEQIAKDCSDGELKLFMKVCEGTGLNPFAKQVYAIKRGGRMTIQVSIDGFRLVAQRSGEYQGQRGPLWCGADGEWKDVWLDEKPPEAAKVGVMRDGFAEPLWAIARWSSYVQSYNGKLSETWKGMPDVMLAKCAEALALRRAFPQELSSLYSEDEMQHLDRPGRPARRPAALTPPADRPRAATAEQPPAEVQTEEETGEVITADQVKAVHGILSQLHPKDEEAQTKLVQQLEPAAVTGTEIHLRSGERPLTKAQGSRLITGLNDELASRKNAGS
jgi:phage recombination protein Bet